MLRTYANLFFFSLIRRFGFKIVEQNFGETNDVRSMAAHRNRPRKTLLNQSRHYHTNPPFHRPLSTKHFTRKWPIYPPTIHLDLPVWPVCFPVRVQISITATRTMVTAATQHRPLVRICRQTIVRHRTIIILIRYGTKRMAIRQFEVLVL